MAGGKGTLLHQIFQRHHLTPEEVMGKPDGIRAFLFASMRVQMEAEEELQQK